MASTYILGTV